MSTETGLAERVIVDSGSHLVEDVDALKDNVAQQRTDFTMLEDVMYSQRTMIERLRERTDELEAQVGSVKKITKIMAVMLFGVGCVMLAFLLHVAGMI